MSIKASKFPMLHCQAHVFSLLTFRLNCFCHLLTWQLATNKPTTQQLPCIPNTNILIRCINLHTTQVLLKTGTTIGFFSSISEDQFSENISEFTSDTPHWSKTSEQVPTDFQTLMDQSQPHNLNHQWQALATLLNKYGDV